MRSSGDGRNEGTPEGCLFQSWEGNGALDLEEKRGGDLQLAYLLHRLCCSSHCHTVA